jgi:hypothetical protein
VVPVLGPSAVGAQHAAPHVRTASNLKACFVRASLLAFRNRFISVLSVTSVLKASANLLHQNRTRNSVIARDSSPRLDFCSPRITATIPSFVLFP